MSRYDYVADGPRRPLLSNPAGPVNLVLAPWQNRISHGGYTFEGQSVSLAPSAPDRFPLHGNAWQRPWQINDRSLDRLSLTLKSDGPSLYRYGATLRYLLMHDGALEMSLTVTNAGPRLPFGLGFHPYFTRTPGTLLEAAAATLILQDPDYMPTDTIAVTTIPRWNFNHAQTIPAGWINNEFGGWNGVAEISWPEWGIGCSLLASGTTRYLVYSPTTDAPFFCFEPITHTVDAFNLPDRFGAGGLVALSAGEQLSLDTTFRPHAI